jgi:hypothetical protein
MTETDTLIRFEEKNLQQGGKGRGRERKNILARVKKIGGGGYSSM